MATVLDVSLLQSFDIVFAAVLVFAIVFAILSKTKLITDNVTFNALIAAVISFLVMLSNTVVQIVNLMIPWFVLVIILLLLLLLIFQVMGASDKNIFEAMKSEKIIIWALLGVGMLIFVIAAGYVLGQDAGPYLTGESNTTSDGTTISGSSTGTADFGTNVTATLFHPKVLGIFVIFGIIITAVLLLTSSK
jgi:hypothetical protein